MSEILKPSNLSLTWASAGDILDPGATKYASGWAVEIPPRQWFNYLDNRQDEAIAHINQRGIAQWDAATEYQGIKSYVQGSNGTVYRSKQTNTNQDPVADVGEVYWQIAFASAGDFYTKTQTDAAYMAKSANGSDIPNSATFRTNLSVYAKSETYTKSEVDSKTTVASTAQSQAWASNTTLLTPLRLSEAFQGANQSVSTNGYQKLPGGLIIQWGVVTEITTETTRTVNYPIAFPTGVLQVIMGGSITTTTDNANMWPQVVSLTSTTSFTWFAQALTGTFDLCGARWVAIGR